MGLSSHNGLAIAEVVIYAPLVVLSFALCIRHSFRIFVGWLFLFLFCAIRIAGAALNLASINKPKTIAFHTTPVELFSVGQVVLIYSTLGLLARVANGINKVRNTGVRGIYIQCLRLPLIAGIILVIIGTDISAGNWITTGAYTINHLTKIGTVIIVAAFAIIVLVVLVFIPRRAEAERSDALLFDMILLSLPLILIRLVYSLLIAFVDDAAFNPLVGNAAAQGLLAVAEEVIVVILYIVAGFRIPKLPKNVVVKTESDWSRRRNRFVTGIQRFQSFTGRVRSHKTLGSDEVNMAPNKLPTESAC